MGHVLDEGTTDGGTPVLQKTTWLTQTDVLAHPAVKAWKAPQPERLEPEAVVILKELSAITRTVTRKSAVYGLEGVGPAGAAVLAKWCRQATVGTKRTIYEEILPHLPIWTMPDWGGWRGVSSRADGAQSMVCRSQGVGAEPGAGRCDGGNGGRCAVSAPMGLGEGHHRGGGRAVAGSVDTVSSVFQDQDTRCERDGLDLLAGPVDHGQSGIPSIFFAQGG